MKTIVRLSGGGWKARLGGSDGTAQTACQRFENQWANLGPRQMPVEPLMRRWFPVPERSPLFRADAVHGLCELPKRPAGRPEQPVEAGVRFAGHRGQLLVVRRC